MTPARLSVVAPAYNAAPTLRETLEGALAQEFSSGECVIGNDGSTLESEKEEHSSTRLTYREILDCTVLLWKGYESLRDYAQAHGITVINATGGGPIDAFPIQDYDDVVHGG